MIIEMFNTVEELKYARRTKGREIINIPSAIPSRLLNRLKWAKLRQCPLRIKVEKEDEDRAGRGVAPTVPAASGSDGNEDRRTSFILTWRVSRGRTERFVVRMQSLARLQGGPFARQYDRR